MGKAVQFGAGKIGRGFLGRLLFEGGFQTTFVDVRPELVRWLNVRTSYPLRLVANDTEERRVVSYQRALDSSADPQRVARAFAEADLVCVSVGVNPLPSLAPLLAACLHARAEAWAGPLNILLGENQWHAAALMRGLLGPRLTPTAQAYLETQIGLVDAVIGLMVPKPTPEQQAEDPLLLVTEPYDELPVDKSQLRGSVPPLPGLLAADNFDAYQARKLYLHNMSHAALAYLGSDRGYQYIWQCAADAEIAALCREALAEAALALAAEYGLDLAALHAYSADLLRRFANRALGDTVARVAADPLRKLRPTDRLVGAAALCRKHGSEPAALSCVIAAALRYNAPADPSALELQRLRRLLGDARVLEMLGEYTHAS